MRSLLTKTILLTALSLFVFGATDALATVEGLRVSTPDTCWFQGGFINLPVKIEWTTWSRDTMCTNNEYLIADSLKYDTVPLWPHWGYCSQYEAPPSQNAREMCAFELKLKWDPQKMQAVTVTGADLLNQWHWPDLYFEIDNSLGTIVVSGAYYSCAQIDNITDPRELLYVGFLITGSPTDDTKLKMEYFKYNEVDSFTIYWYNEDYAGRPEARTIGKFNVCEPLHFGGKINYCSNGIPVCGADVTLHYLPDTTVTPPPDIPDKTVQTQCDANCQDDCRGAYLINDIIGGYHYCVSAWKDDEYDNAISAFDASLILRYLVNMLNFDCCQKVAADVTGNCCISSYDASHILKYLVGEFDYFPKHEAEKTNWEFFVENAIYSPGCPDDRDCLCPQDSICYSPLVDNKYNQDFKAVILGDVSGNWGISTGGKIAVKDIGELCRVKVLQTDEKETVYEITADFGEAYAFQFELTGTTDKAHVLPGGEGWLYQVNRKENRLIVATAGTTPSTATLPLRIVVENDANVSLSNLVVNESHIPGSLLLKGTVLPSNYELANNYPNPFNPETHIAFSLPKETDLTLTVFNILGQHVKTLASGHFEAGRHEVVWDGTNEAGVAVTSGVYLYRLETGDFTETKKMMLLK